MKKYLLFLMVFVFFNLSFAADGEKRIAVVCAGCHGTNGASVGDSIPIIGGQNKDYLKKVMKEYREDKRVGSVMLKIAKGYNEERVEYIAKFFSTQKWVNSNKPFDKKLAEEGEKIAVICFDCHGKNGKGMDEYPRIAGQHVFYLKQVLKEYKDGINKNDEMSLLKEYSDEQIEALANYFSSIRQ